MDRDLLKTYLSQGLSLDQIAVLANRDPSMVGYWVKQHGLIPNGRDKHARRGGLTRGELEPLVEDGLSIREIAVRTPFSPSTVRYWLRKFGLETHPGRRRAYSIAQSKSANGATRAVLRCRRHGDVVFKRRPDGGYRCVKCAQEAVMKRRRAVKRALVREAGGRCAICGYDRHVAALEFHHVDPSAKSFGLSLHGITRSLDELRSEAAKCILLCGNCHAEVEAGFTSLPRRYSSGTASSQAA